MVTNGVKKRKAVMQNITKRKQYVDSMLQKLLFDLLINNQGEMIDLSKRVEATIGQVENIIKKTTL